MKSRKTPEILAGGVDQRWKANSNFAQRIKNCRVEDTGLGWVNDRGWEPMIMSPDSMSVTLPDATVADLQLPTRFLKIWSRHGGSEVYYLYERGGKLSYIRGNAGTGTAQVDIATDRNLPKASDPGTQLTPFGRWALVQNGYDRPFKFWGRNKTTPFGWSQRPNAPTLFNTDPTYLVNPVDTGARDCGFPWATDNKFLGLGNSAEGEFSHYRYKVSFVSDTGSESPLSDDVGQQWVISVAGEVSKWASILSDIPLGPTGTVARRLYRTKNLENNPGEVYFLCTQLDDNSVTDWVDSLPDDLLLEEAPSGNASIVLPQSFKYAASWNGVMWIGGGDDLSTVVRYSDRYLPEQFNRFRFFDVGARTGGHITALVPYNNSLLVFREKSIDVISAISDDTYTIGNLTSDIGTRATNTIKQVPGVGLMFLTHDGVYYIKGGQSGGGQFDGQVLKASTSLHGEWKRLSEGSLARATACYSSREKEYWVHYPVDGETENSRGAVYHTQMNTWSLRNLSDPSVAIGNFDGYGMYFTCLDTDPEGWICIGTYPNFPFTSSTDENLTAFPGYGLQVWSAYPYWGHQLSWTANGDGTVSYDILQSARALIDTAYISTFNDFGDDSIKKRVSYVEVEMISKGYNDLTLVYRTDYGFRSVTGGLASPMLVENYKTTQSEPVWTGSVAPTDIKNLATWGDNWSGDQVCRVRFDVHTGLIAQFAWGIESSEPFHIVSYQVHYTSSNRQVPNHGGSNGS